MSGTPLSGFMAHVFLFIFVLVVVYMLLIFAPEANSSDSYYSCQSNKIVVSALSGSRIAANY
jgi:hypothetical protein